ncbi:hypothetical protein EAO68_01430 [Streptomyces sp. wa22]|nr:hypothetical protein EAO68_01430 [Streptomyces sp. wa22]
MPIVEAHLGPAHQPFPAVDLADDSPEHHLLKPEPAVVARAAGWWAELEVSSETLAGCPRSTTGQAEDAGRQ